MLFVRIMNKQFAAIITGCPWLQCLVLSGCGIGRQGGSDLGAALSEAKQSGNGALNLVELDISGNRLGDGGLTAVSPVVTCMYIITNLVVYAPLSFNTRIRIPHAVFLSSLPVCPSKLRFLRV